MTKSKLAELMKWIKNEYLLDGFPLEHFYKYDNFMKIQLLRGEKPNQVYCFITGIELFNQELIRKQIKKELKKCSK